MPQRLGPRRDNPLAVVIEAQVEAVNVVLQRATDPARRPGCSTMRRHMPGGQAGYEVRSEVMARDPNSAFGKGKRLR